MKSGKEVWPSQRPKQFQWNGQLESASKTSSCQVTPYEVQSLWSTNHHLQCLVCYQFVSHWQVLFCFALPKSVFEFTFGDAHSSRCLGEQWIALDVLAGRLWMPIVMDNRTYCIHSFMSHKPKLSHWKSCGSWTKSGSGGTQEAIVQVVITLSFTIYLTSHGHSPSIPNLNPAQPLHMASQWVLYKWIFWGKRKSQAVAAWIRQSRVAAVCDCSSQAVQTSTLMLPTLRLVCFKSILLNFPDPMNMTLSGGRFGDCLLWPNGMDA